MIILSNFVYLKMFLPKLFLMSILLHIAEGFTVKGASGPLVVPLGGSVLLPCSVDSLSSLKDLEVEWKRSDSQTLIHLYQDGDIKPEVQHEDYSGRAHFFTDDIKHGNFSLLLMNVTAEDEGQYTCTVHNGLESGETVLEIKDIERLMVSGSDQSISVYVGEDVTLNCSVDSHIPPEDIEEVTWKKRVKDEHITVLLYQNNEVYPEASDEQYRDRVEFFSDEIHRGNFSLRLKRVRTEDKGLYMCQVFAGRLSDNTTVVLQQLGLSGLHIMVLILCISALGSALLICSLIYCRSHTGFSVEGFYGPVSLESSVVLACFNNKLSPVEVKKVKWMKSGLKGPVCVFQDGDSRSEVQHPDYHDRAHFFTDNIKHGNFSLMLKNLRQEDKGKYTCKVYKQQRPVLSVSVDLQYYEEEHSFFVVYSCDLVVPPGGSLVLPCCNDKPLLEEELKVEWSKSDLESPVFVYQDGIIRPENQHEDYHERAHFFNDNIQLGNFSLLLKNVTAQDEGKYTCRVYSRQRPFINVMTLVQRPLDTALRLQMSLVFCPNIIMFFAFVFWGVSEGSVNETVLCCALYIVRPLMLLYTAPYKAQFTGKIQTLLAWSLHTDYISFTTVVYSVLFKSAWEKSLNFTASDRAMIIALFVIVLLLCLIYSINVLLKITVKLSQRMNTILDVVAEITFYVLPSLQFVLLFFTFGSATGGFIIVAVLPVITSATRYNWNIVCGDTMGCSPLVRRLVWIVLMCFMNTVLMFFYITALEKENDRVGWACTIGFLQVIWTVWNCLWSFHDWGFTRITAVYVFGSVGVVLFSAVGLMTELILKTLNGEGLVGDLRIIVFSSESLFTALVVIIVILSPWIKKDLQCCQIPAKCKKAAPTELPQNQNAAGDQEMNPLVNPQETDKHREADKTQPDSQT